MHHENETFTCQECGNILSWGFTLREVFGTSRIAFYYCGNEECDNYGIRKV